MESANCTTGKVRLQGGVKSNEGRVELCINNVWGSICDYGWNTNDAAVVCNQLGYSSKGRPVPLRVSIFFPHVFQKFS